MTNRHRRVVTITPNPAVDTTYLLGSLTPGEINRVERALPVAGGKGNNVARVLAALGQRPTATGFVGGHTGTFIVDGLTAAGVVPSFIEVAQASRVCLTIVAQETGQITEIRESGPRLTAADAERLLSHVEALAGEAEIVAVSGSLPPGLPPEFAADLVRCLKARGAFVALDSGGEALRQGLRGRPDLIKPNRAEIVELVGAFRNLPEVIDRVQSRLFDSDSGVTVGVLLSLGAEGAVLIERDRAVVVKPPPISPVNVVGSGDALLAGFLDAHARGLDLATAVARGVATGTAAALQEAVGEVDAAEVERLARDVRVETMSSPSSIARFDDFDVHHHDSRQRCAVR